MLSNHLEMRWIRQFWSDANVNVSVASEIYSQIVRYILYVYRSGLGKTRTNTKSFVYLCFSISFRFTLFSFCVFVILVFHLVVGGSMLYPCARRSVFFFFSFWYYFFHFAVPKKHIYSIHAAIDASLYVYCVYMEYMKCVDKVYSRYQAFPDACLINK